LLGNHLARAGHIPVPREDPRGAVRTMSLAASIIREKGISILIFPEGGRSHDGLMRPFKDGAAYIAIKAGVPVVPVALQGTRAILPFGSGKIRPGRVVLKIGEPIQTSSLTLRDRSAVTAQVRDQIANMLA
jgi:1-acyl-sn-glycerol-3-phosphate acyltransferase